MRSWKIRRVTGSPFGAFKDVLRFPDRIFLFEIDRQQDASHLKLGGLCVSGINFQQQLGGIGGYVRERIRRVRSEVGQIDATGRKLPQRFQFLDGRPRHARSLRRGDEIEGEWQTHALVKWHARAYSALQPGDLNATAILGRNVAKRLRPIETSTGRPVEHVCFRMEVCPVERPDLMPPIRPNQNPLRLLRIAVDRELEKIGTFVVPVDFAQIGPIDEVRGLKFRANRAVSTTTYRRVDYNFGSSLV